MSQNHGRSSTQKRVLKAKLFGGRNLRPCCFCRRLLTPTTATLEHVVPLSRGGGWALDNLRLSCEPCNTQRGNDDFDLYRQHKRRELAALRAAVTEAAE